MLAFEMLTFGFAWWLGLYLLARDPAKALLRRAGAGLIAYALALATDLLSVYAPTVALGTILTRAHWLLIFLPALFWSGALVRLLPEDAAPRAGLDRAWLYGLLPVALLADVLAAAANLMFGRSADVSYIGSAYLVVALLTLLPLLGGVLLVGRIYHSVRPQRSFGLLLVAMLFFGLSTVLLASPLAWLPRAWNILAIGGDLALFGVAVAMLDAFDEGETLQPDIARSLAAASLAALLFGLLVTLALLSGAGPPFSLLALLLATVAVAIALQVFADPIQALLDRLSFAGAPRLRRARADLRAASGALSRVKPDLALESMDEAEFVRLTRRALGHYGDLPRLATSPLSYLPAIGARLAERGASDHPLERAAELKALLGESIARLKPRGKGDFGIIDEWRHYNALYFPYVVGLKPYSRQASHAKLDPAAQEALDWLRTMVPERTLHNWQNAAAKLVAQDLRAGLEDDTMTR